MRTSDLAQNFHERKCDESDGKNFVLLASARARQGEPFDGRGGDSSRWKDGTGKQSQSLVSSLVIALDPIPEKPECDCGPKSARDRLFSIAIVPAAPCSPTNSLA